MPLLSFIDTVGYLRIHCMCYDVMNDASSYLPFVFNSSYSNPLCLSTRPSMGNQIELKVFCVSCCKKNRIFSVYKVEICILPVCVESGSCQDSPVGLSRHPVCFLISILRQHVNTCTRAHAQGET